MEDRGSRLREKLLGWYREGKRDLPWRRTRDPYAILVAEFLLQRTRIATGLPYYERFLARFPTVQDLAAASESDVLRVWEGLGFYGRARKLHEAAKMIVARHGGAVPADLEALQALPGVGPYTAGAVGSIAFGLRAPALDGNARRVIARLRWSRVKSRAGSELETIARELVPADSPGEWNQALMDLGATVCVPRRPRCTVCPVSDECDAFAEGVQDRVPPRRRSRPIPTTAVMFALVEDHGRILLVQRPSDGLLAGLWSLPGGEAGTASGLRGLVREQTGLDINPRAAVAKVDHTFSHRRWSGRVVRARVRGGRLRGGRWFRREDLASVALVPFHRRVVIHVSPAGFPPLDSPRRAARTVR